MIIVPVITRENAGVTEVQTAWNKSMETFVQVRRLKKGEQYLFLDCCFKLVDFSTKTALTPR